MFTSVFIFQFTNLRIRYQLLQVFSQLLLG